MAPIPEDTSKGNHLYQAWLARVTKDGGDTTWEAYEAYVEDQVERYFEK